MQHTQLLLLKTFLSNLLCSFFGFFSVPCMEWGVCQNLDEYNLTQHCTMKLLFFVFPFPGFVSVGLGHKGDGGGWFHPSLLAGLP